MEKRGVSVQLALIWSDKIDEGNRGRTWNVETRKR